MRRTIRPDLARRPLLPPGGFHIDPFAPVDKAVSTHAHSDHPAPATARAGHSRNPRTDAAAPGREFCRHHPNLAYGETVTIGGVAVTCCPPATCSVAQVSGKDVFAPYASGALQRRCGSDLHALLAGPLRHLHQPRRLRAAGVPPRPSEDRSHADKSRRVPERGHVVGVYALGKRSG